MADKKILIFGKQNCGACAKAKNRVGHYVNKWGLDSEVPVVFMDMESAEGLAEGAFRDVLAVPTTIVEEGENTLARWDGEPPKSESLRALLTA